MATGVSGSFELSGSYGVTLSIHYEETYDPITNNSSVRISKVRLKSSWYYGYTYYLDGTISIDGTTAVRMSSVDGTSSVRTNALNTYSTVGGSLGSVSNISHNENGSKSISIAVNLRGYTLGGDGGSGWTVSGSKSVDLTAIDRTAPVVSCSVSSITSSGFRISATSNVTSDIWEYSINNGGSWTQFSTSETTAASIDLTSLSPNTTYSVKVRARKKYNQVFGSSNAISVKTLGASVIVSANSFDVDVNAPTIAFNLTVYDSSYYHRMVLRNGSTQLFSVDLGKFSAGTAERHYALTQENKTTVLSAMVSNPTKAFKLVVVTYSSSSYSTQIGSESLADITARTDVSRSAPVFSGFSYADVQNIATAATEDSSVLIQNHSLLQVVCREGEAKNGARITGYSASIGNASMTGSNTILDVGPVSSSGDLTLSVTCTDSRGYSTTIQEVVKVLPYKEPKIDSCTLRRENDVGTLIQLSLNGSISTIMADGENNTNAVTGVSYVFKKTVEDEWSPLVSILDNVKVSGNRFSFESLELEELDTESSYDFRIFVTDKLYELSEYELVLVLRQGTPVVAIRKRNKTYPYGRVGINKMHPTKPLDVEGDAAVSGELSVSGRLYGFSAPVNDGDAVNKGSLLDLIYPVGSIYLSVGSTSPAKLFGGKWEQIKDRFLLAAGSSYTGGDTGGSATVTLTAENIPSHIHRSSQYLVNASGLGTAIGIGSGSAYTFGYNAAHETTAVGSGTAHGNMPPYLVVYVWKRTE